MVVRERRRGRALAVTTWGFAAVVLFGLTLMKWWGDLWWPGTVLLYMPRALWLVPLLGLVFWNLGPRRSDLWGLQAAVGLVILGPLMGLHVPWNSLIGSQPEGGQLRLRILTLNRYTVELDAERLIALIESEGIDLLCFQEGRGNNGSLNPKLDAFLAKDWHWERNHFLASRLPIVAEADWLDPPYPEGGFWGVRMVWVDVKTESGAVIRVADVHMPTMTNGFQWLFQGDLARMSRFQYWRRQQVSEILEHVVGTSRLPILLAGDFNAPSDSPLLDPLRSVFRFGFEEVGLGYGYTRPATLAWVGIDHVLASSEWTFTRCWVGPDVGSDHLPLIAEVVRNGAPASPSSP